MINYNRATKYLERKNYAKAIQFYKRQLKESEFKECYLNMGNSYRGMGDLNEALKCYLKANSAEVNFSNGDRGSYDFALGNLGLLEYMHGNDDAAIAFYTAALELNPLHFDSIWNYSSALLRKYCSNESVDVSSAWKMYEYRFKRSSPIQIDNTIPHWDGTSNGKSIIVLAEQGIGDKFMWGRYLYLLKQKFETVWVQCPEQMDCVFSSYNTCRLVSETDAEVSVPFCSLAMYFPNSRSTWLEKKFGARDFGPGMHIGIEWAGSSTHANDANRSCLPVHFQQLAKYGKLYNMRPDATPVRGVISLNPSGWKETAEIVNGLDLIISVDTSVVHLAGSLGRPCWMLQPLLETDFRWGNDSMGESNIWYPTVSVIRNSGSWERTFAKVMAKLELNRLIDWRRHFEDKIGFMYDDMVSERHLDV